MSNTKKQKIKGKVNRMNKSVRQVEKALIDKLIAYGVDVMPAIKAVHDLTRNVIWNKMTEEEKLMVFSGYSKNPSWWNRLFNRRPKRRADRDMLKTVDLNDERDLIFSDDDKPDKYYW